MNTNFSNKLNYIKFSGTDPTSPLHPSLPACSRTVQFLVDSVGQCTSNAEVDPLFQHILQCLPGAIADHIIINTTNRYNRKLRLAVFVFGWVHCRVFENLMGTQVKPLDCAWADKTLSQPITLFYSLSLSSWTQDTVCPCKNWLKLRPVDIGRQLVLASCQFGCRQLKISTTRRLSVHPPPNWSRAPWLSPAPNGSRFKRKTTTTGEPATRRRWRIQWQRWIGIGRFDAERLNDNFQCRLPRVDTASVITGRQILKGWRWHSNGLFNV